MIFMNKAHGVNFHRVRPGTGLMASINLASAKSSRKRAELMTGAHHVAQHGALSLFTNWLIANFFGEYIDEWAVESFRKIRIIPHPSRRNKALAVHADWSTSCTLVIERIMMPHRAHSCRADILIISFDHYYTCGYFVIKTKCIMWDNMAIWQKRPGLLSSYYVS